jgi:hypothetical protein
MDRGWKSLEKQARKSLYSYEWSSKGDPDDSSEEEKKCREKMKFKKLFN